MSLKQIKDRPVCLFYKGNLSLLHSPCLAIIGSRDCSEYGKKIAMQIAFELSKLDITIVTGGARGIDSYANLGAIQASKPSIIVLGNSLDYIYPPENQQLEIEVLKNNGLILTEYWNGTRGTKWTFPARNRIISGLAQGVLVVEAKQKSGTLITVDYALEQGKEVYAIPGNLYQENSIGTNMLIQEGAKIVTKLSDILEDYF